MQHGEGYPDPSLRLFHRDHAHWSTDPVHERVQTRETVRSLSGDLLHESDQTLDQYLDKQNRYTTLQARARIARGKRSGVGNLIVSPLWRFIKFYILKRGFLDGVPGLVHISIGCFNSFMKHAKTLAESPPRISSARPDRPHKDDTDHTPETQGA